MIEHNGQMKRQTNGHNGDVRLSVCPLDGVWHKVDNLRTNQIAVI